MASGGAAPWRPVSGRRCTAVRAPHQVPSRRGCRRGRLALSAKARCVAALTAVARARLVACAVVCFARCAVAAAAAGAWLNTAGARLIMHAHCCGQVAAPGSPQCSGRCAVTVHRSVKLMSWGRTRFPVNCCGQAGPSPEARPALRPRRTARPRPRRAPYALRSASPPVSSSGRGALLVRPSTLGCTTLPYPTLMQRALGNCLPSINPADARKQI